MRLMIALACLSAGAALGGCVNAGTNLSQEQACEFHNENDPVERDRCRQPVNNRADTVPDVRPQELPIRTGQPSD